MGGFTRHPRSDRRSLLLGVRDAGRLRYVGQAVVPLAGRSVAPLWRRLVDLHTASSPFAASPKGVKRQPVWVRPDVVVEVSHDGFRADGTFRRPAIFERLRGNAHVPTVHHEGPASLGVGAGPERAYSGWRPGPSSGRRTTPALARLVRDLERIEARGGAGTLRFPDGARLSVSRLTAVVWPTLGITKGALMRYYVRVAPLILPTLEGRPLGAKYYPEGLAGESFFQQRAPLAPPPGARIEILPINTPVKRRLVGGPLLTLLAMIELGAISQDPWLSRLPSLDTPDHAVFDLDPMPGVPFASVIDVARWLHDELARHGATAFAKTSGGTGLHVYVPLVAGIPFDSARRFTEWIAAPVAARHARLATTERAVAVRGERVYIDCLQNLRGKTLATAYSARATWSGGVSTPITWDELESGIAPGDFTLRTLPARLRAHGDLWAACRESRGFDPRSGDTRGR